mgnify:CR=1 FL=1
MRISTEIGSAARLVGEEKAVELVAKAGFDAYDLSMFSMARYDWNAKCVAQTDHPFRGKNYLKFVRNLRHIAEDNGIVCNQSHAPFPVFSPEIRGFLKRAIECTAEAGGKICVIHPDNYKSAEENAEMYYELLPFAKECGVKIATENMWGWDKTADHAIPNACSSPESFCAHIDIINDPFFVACLDIGHAEMKGLGTSARELIHALGDRLQALHMHDNDRWHDSHRLPFTMDIDFTDVVTALKEINYTGDFTLEADQHLTDPNTVAEGLKEMAQATRRLANMFACL